MFILLRITYIIFIINITFTLFTSKYTFTTFYYKPNNKFVSFNKNWEIGTEFNVERINLGDEFCVSFVAKKLMGCGGAVDIFVS